MSRKIEPQKSEVHESTADASGSPTAAGDTATTRSTSRRNRRRKAPKRQPEPLTPDTVILQDDTDDGGPLVVKSGDPDLNPPQTPKDPFPTDRTPEIDPPAERR